MPTESELRDALRKGAEAPGRLDAEAVIRGSRARRRPRQLVLGSAAVLAVVGFCYAGITAIPWPQAALMAASEDVGEASTGYDLAVPQSSSSATDPVTGAPQPGSALSANRCGLPSVEAGASSSGLLLTTDFPLTAAANGLPVEGVVTLENTGEQRVVGLTAAQPVIVLSRDGVTVWHTTSGSLSVGTLVDLAPGQSKQYPASFTPVLCTEEDEDALSFPVDLPPLGTGTYRVRALLDLVPLASARDAAGELVGGPGQDVALVGG